MQDIATYLMGLLGIFNDMMNDVVNILTTGPEAFNETIYKMTNVIPGGFTAIGVSLLILFFYMNLMQTYSSMTELKRPEIIFKELFRLVISNLVVTNAFSLMVHITTIGNGIILSGYNSAWQYTGVFAGMQLDENLENALAEMDFGWLSLKLATFFTMLIALVLMVAIAIASIYLLVGAYGRIFKCYLYMAISPIPLATFGCRGTAEVGKHFIKSYCGVLLQGLIMVLAMLFFQAFLQSGDAFDTNSDNVVIMMLKWGVSTLVRIFTLITVIKAADRVTHDMLGI